MKAWERYPALAAAVARTHDGKAYYAHDLTHVLIVAGLCAVIHEDEEVARLAGIAALCHNADRILQKAGDLGIDGDVPETDTERMVIDWLKTEPTITAGDRKVVLDVVLRHNKLNDPLDPPALVTMMDADRLAIMSPDNIIREGQYRGDNVPTVDIVHFLEDPSATYRDPKSLLRSTREWLDWVDWNKPKLCLRLPKARMLGFQRAEFLRLFHRTELEHLWEAGVVGVSIPT